ncbi:MAG: hypothetical protein GY788_13040 [bacterium]|nr:hypothetical protein [bacterium]
MMRLFVRDLDPVSGHLIGVECLIEVLLELRLVSRGVDWRIRRGAWGHGTWVCALEDRLAAAEWISVSPEALLAALQAGEYFYDVAFDFASGSIAAAGLVDSAYLFVEGARSELDAVAARFGETELVDGCN